MRRLAKLVALALAALALLGNLAAPAGAMGIATTAGAAPAVNINEVEEEVMCPVCGTLLALAESPQAQREKAFVARLIGEGRSKGEIKNALVDQYGSAVLALPKSSGFDLSAYLVPIVAFVLAVVLLGYGVYRWRRSTGPPGARPSPGQGLTEAERQRLDADLGRYDL